MSSAGFFRRAMVVALVTVAFASVGSPVLLAQEPAAGGPAPVLHLFGVALGLGLIVVGAAMGIGKITAAVNLPLFLLEGVAILAEVFALLVLLLTT
jgi:hypothetical protein